MLSSRAKLLTLCAAWPQPAMLPASAWPTETLASSLQGTHHAEQPRGGKYILPALPNKIIQTHDVSMLPVAC